MQRDRLRSLRWPQVDELVASTVAAYGGVDILVANAGIVRAAEFLDMSEQDFDDVIRVNLKGTFLVRRLPVTLIKHPVLKPISQPETLLKQLGHPHRRCAQWMCCTQTGQAVGRQMVKQNEATPGRGGAIVNMSSVNAVMAIPTVAGYNASKGGIANLTRSDPS